jgi:NADH-quinone oxidoreductase subunit L
MKYENLPWLTLFLPIFAAGFITLFTLRSKTLSSLISIGAVVAGFIMTCIFINANGFHFSGESVKQWLSIGDLQVDFGLKLDALSMMMMLIVTGVGGLIHIYSYGYMDHDPGKARFFAELSLFTFSMLGIVLANNFLEMFIFWELVGVSSYLLIGFWYEKPSAGDAAKKAFIVNRLGDFGFLLGILMVWVAQHSLNFSGLQSFGIMSTMAGLLIFCGAAGKSAQFPLHVWLPDAMEGPTPVSALIHAVPDFSVVRPRCVAGRCLHRRFYGVVGCADCRPTKRHQAYHCLFDSFTTGLHGHGRGFERPDNGDVPFDHPRFFQSPAVPGRGFSHPRAA